MPASSPPPRHDLAVILGLFALLLFASPLTGWLARLELPWYVPYALWGMVVLLAALITLGIERDEP